MQEHLARLYVAIRDMNLELVQDLPMSNVKTYGLILK